jgi:hypothetical protein
MGKCDVALSLRDPSDQEHRYNFPSKILEYLSKSKVVISTVKYKDIDNGLLFYSEFDVRSLSKTLDLLYILPCEDIIFRRGYIKNHLINNFTEQKVVQILKELINV